jgi:thioesterase domain-containing protein
MTNAEFQEFLHHSIPATAHMAFRVEEYAHGPVKIMAPLPENQNIGGTAFGGSVSTLLITVCWAEVYKLMQSVDPKCEVVIQQGQAEFKAPIITDFAAVAYPPTTEKVALMLGTYHRFGRARISMQSGITIDNREVAQFKGSFVILK